MIGMSWKRTRRSGSLVAGASLLAWATLALAVPLAGQTASDADDFGDDSSAWANDGVCDDTRFIGYRGAGAWAANGDHVGKDATDCRNLLNAGRIRRGTVSENIERFELFTRCQPLGITLFVQGDQADEIDLTEERVRTMVESRLRAARLYASGDGVPFLAVNILTLDDGPAFVRHIRLLKWNRDDMTGLERGSVTWESLGFGTHGRDAGFIMQGLSEDLDRFILEYLRVNEGFC